MAVFLCGQRAEHPGDGGFADEVARAELGGMEFACSDVAADGLNAWAMSRGELLSDFLRGEVVMAADVDGHVWA